MWWLYHTVGDTLDPKWGNCVIFLLRPLLLVLPADHSNPSILSTGLPRKQVVLVLSRMSPKTI